MANIILPAVPVLNEIDDNTKLLIEQAGEINRYPISNLDVNIDIDTSLSTTSENPVQNKIITEAIDNIINNTADTIQTKTGEVITADNSAYVPMHGLKLYGKTTQNGTPTPDAPVELDSVGADGSVAVKVCGKNLLRYPYSHKTFTTNGITFTDNGDGSVTANGTATANAYFNLDFTSTNLIPGGDYIASSTGDDSTALYLDITYFREDGTYANACQKARTPKRFTVPNDYVKTRAFLCVPKGGTADNITAYPMVRHVSATDETYEPYKGQTLNVSTPNGLPGIPVASGGNYTDESGQQWICDEVDFEKGVYVQRVEKRVFTGTEAFRLHASGRYYLDIANGRFAITDTWGLFSNDVSREGGTQFGSSGVYFKTAHSTVDEFKAYLADNYASGQPITAQIVLRTFTETALSAEQLAAFAALHTNYPNTTVFNDEGADMEVKYYTPTTAVPVAYGAAHSGKVLSVDEHGCVTPISPDFVRIDLDDANEGEPSNVNADTFGGYSPEHYATTEMVNSIKPENIGALSMDLLWENADRTSEFAAQTIPLDLSEYSYVLIQFCRSWDGTHTYSEIGKVGDGLQYLLRNFYAKWRYRNCKITVTGIEIGEEYAFTTYTDSESSATGSKKFTIPLRIYGIKG